jgi:hypothetical protein
MRVPVGGKHAGSRTPERPPGLWALVLGFVLLTLAGACDRRALPGEWDAGTDGTVWPDGNVAAGGFIWVVDDAFHLRRYHPTTNSFSLVGKLHCPGTTDNAFSMAVDRGGRAWVLDDIGQVFWVDTADASCEASRYPTGQGGFSSFGMGFVADAPGSGAETLFIAGAYSEALLAGTLARVDPQTLELSVVGELDTPAVLKLSTPELTGTGSGELYGYFPGDAASWIARIDKQNAGLLETWTVPGVQGQLQAWAFAHWGGAFYIFITGDSTAVLRFDPATGKTETIRTGMPFTIVGAGVTSMAPVSTVDAGPD